MKTSYATTSLAALILAFGAMMTSPSPALAQNPTAPQQDQAGPEGGHGGYGHRQEHQLQMLTKKLNLTPDQVTQVKAIQDDSRTQMMAVRDDASTAQPDKRAKMMDIRKASQDKIRALLTDEQKPKYDEVIAHAQEHRERHQGGEEGAPPTAPQQ